MEELKITRERAIKRMEWILKHEIYCSDKLSHAAINMAITALRSAKPENKVLTLEQLRQMNGEPVWIALLNIAKQPTCEVITKICEDGIHTVGTEGSDYASFGLYGKTWLAYDHKPEGSEEK